MTKIYDIGPFRLDADAGVLTREGRPTALGPRAAAVLAKLVEKPNEYVHKDEILRAAWPCVVVEEGNLAVQISAIRRVLARAPGGRHWIETLAKRGYRFVGPVAMPSEVRSDVPSAGRRSNLVEAVTSFVGRERELVELKGLLPRKRLVTLVGVGGIGKTRLALQAAAEVIDAYRDGVWLAELGAITDPKLVPKSVARVLGVKESAGTPIEESICAHLEARELLLILDNCEHLLDACARLAHTLLKRAPHTTVVATSREPLHIDGEQTYALQPMSLSDPATSIDEIGRSDAVQLFVVRAQQQLPDFRLTAARAPAIAQLCMHLDGIPLALELAAARVRSLAIDEINARLDDRFRLLAGGSRTAAPRHHTLRALVDWSYDLLTAPEQRLLQQLSVFAGGWTLEAAEHVCGGDVRNGEVLDLLTSLVDKSMVAADLRDTQVRYRLLETLRQYGAEKLTQSGEAEAIRARHRDHFLAFAEVAEPSLMAADQAAWLERVEIEHENLRASLEWSAKQPGSVAGCRLCSALQRFWITRGHIAEAREWCRRVLAGPTDEPHAVERAKALNTAGILAFYQSDYPVAKALHGEALAIRRRLDHRRGIATSLNNLGNVHYDEGDYHGARAMHEESLAIKRELGDRRGTASSLNNLGNVAIDLCEFATARALYEESVAIQRELGDRGDMATALSNLGIAHYEEGNHATSQALHEESLAIMRELGDRAGISQAFNNLAQLAFERGELESAQALYGESLAIDRDLGDRWALAHTLFGMADVAAGRGKNLRAAKLWGAAEQLRSELGAPLPPNDRPRHERHVRAARATLDDPADFERAWQEGRALTPAQATAIALET